MDFVALDFETTGSYRNAAISIGIALFSNNRVVDTFYTLIDPKEKIAPYTIPIHGLTDKDVRGQKEFFEVYPDIEKYLHYPLVAHNARFDASVLEQCAQRYGIELPELEVYDTLTLYRSNYPGHRHYRLDDCCNRHGVILENHHNALDDALACGYLFVNLIENQMKLTSFSRGKGHQKFVVPSQGYTKEPLYKFPKVDFDVIYQLDIQGKTFVITGDFEKYSRDEIERKILSKGGLIKFSVTKTTDYLIVGYSNMNLVKNKDGKSSKICKAEEYRCAGCSIKLLNGTEWIEEMMK